MRLLDRVHGQHVHVRRVRVIGEQIATLLPRNARVLDVGCGDGSLAASIKERRPDLDFSGIDVLVRSKTSIPVQQFNGSRIPYGDRSLDVVMFVDVLHHTDDPMVLLREATRTASTAIVVKDHTLTGPFAGPTLRFMDWVGNARHGVALPYNYWKRQQWFDACEQLGLEIGVWQADLKIYPWPATWVFDRSLHFIARFDPHDRSVSSPQ